MRWQFFGACLSHIWPAKLGGVSWPRPLIFTDTDADKMAAAYLHDIISATL
jgi:hypothetical protein